MLQDLATTKSVKALAHENQNRSAGSLRAVACKVDELSHSALDVSVGTSVIGGERPIGKSEERPARPQMTEFSADLAMVMGIHTQPDIPSVSAPDGPSQDQTTPLFVYAFALIGVLIIVTAMFHRSGPNVIAEIVGYVGCLGFIKISMKLVYGCGFLFPKFITAIHLFVSTLAAFCILFHRSYAKNKSIVVPTLHELVFVIGPISLTFGLSIVCDNQSLVLLSASFAESISATTPVVSAIIGRLLGIPFSYILLFPMSLTITGCIISVSGAVKFSALGIGLIIIAITLRSLKAVLQQRVMTMETRERFDPVTLMMWSCMIGCVELVCMSIFTEGARPINALVASPNPGPLLRAIGVSCVVAVALNMLALFVIEELGAVGMQVVSQMKSILVVMGAVALLHENLTAVQSAGFLLVLVGIFVFSQLKQSVAMTPQIVAGRTETEDSQGDMERPKHAPSGKPVGKV
eukprot:TRINITY_DN8335_c0_g1_i2.p1 TRINITY_DN8335_c0_g1~~TRINITY_DN8335_c0_g1_i2.p1  ORF type:complete len:514 (-),score=48.16 TRINITY_DN8335_c0_g1_i2:140-1528(-)